MLIQHKEESIEVRTHPQYPRYRVSADGRIFLPRTGLITRGTFKELKAFVPGATGYKEMSLIHCCGKRKKAYVHRMVAICFIPNEKGVREVKHLDGDKLNNTVGNLAWTATREHRAQKISRNL